MSRTLSLSKVLKSQAGWYRGDFHAHTNFSDGYYYPSELVDVAKVEGLDFFAITDHNTLDSFPNFAPPSDVLIISGLEATLDEGHFNIFGLEGWSSWMEHICTGQNRVKLKGNYGTTAQVMQQTSSEGLLNSINHPLLKPWAWQDNTTDLRHLHCLEIWNDPSWPDNAKANPQAVALWTEWLNAGHRITAIGGSDYHRPTPRPNENKPPERLGQPSTYVYATELSGRAILAGLRQRRAYVSMGPQVTFQAQSNGTIYKIGADLGELGGMIEFRASVSHNPSPLQVQLVKNGHVIAAVLVEDGQASLQCNDKANPSQPAWYRLDVLDQNGQIGVITNPIFVGPQPEAALWTYGAFAGNSTHEQ